MVGPGRLGGRVLEGQEVMGDGDTHPPIVWISHCRFCYKSQVCVYVCVCVFVRIDRWGVSTFTYFKSTEMGILGKGLESSGGFGV